MIGNALLIAAETSGAELLRNARTIHCSKRALVVFFALQELSAFSTQLSAKTEKLTADC